MLSVFNDKPSAEAAQTLFELEGAALREFEDHDVKVTLVAQLMDEMTYESCYGLGADAPEENNQDEEVVMMSEPQNQVTEIIFD